MSNKKTSAKEFKPFKISSVDFCIAMSGNREGLERLLYSLVEFYPGGKIIIVDNARQLDRAYYKRLRSELADAGLLNRFEVHHIAFNATIAMAFNQLLSFGKSKYRVLLTDEDFFTEETSIEEMVNVMEDKKTIGIVGGSLNDEAPVIDGQMVKSGSLSYGIAKQLNRFMMVQGDVKNYIRFKDDVSDFVADFCTRVPKQVPYQMAVAEVRLSNYKITDEDDESKTENTASSGEGGGGAAGSTVPSTDGEQSGDADVLPSRQDEESQDPAVSGRQSRGNNRSSRR